MTRGLEIVGAWLLGLPLALPIAIVVFLASFLEIEVNLAGEAGAAAGLVDRRVLDGRAAHQGDAKSGDEK